MDVSPIVLWGVALAAALIALPRLILWHKRPRQADRLLADWGCKTRAKQLDEDLLEDVAGYWREIRAEIPPEAIVDDITWRDLDMDEVFRRMDFTFSAAGSESLYALMRFTGEKDAALARRSEILDALRSDRASRKALFSGLVRMPRERFCGAVSLLYSSERMGPECPWLYYALAVLPLAIALGALLYPPLLLGLAISFLLNLVLHLLGDLHWWREKNAVAHLFRVLDAACALSRRDCPALSPEIARLRELSDALKPLRKRMRSLVPDDSDSLIGILAFYPRVLFLQDMVRLCRTAGALYRHKDELRELYRRMGELDALQSLAALRESREDWCIPQFSPRRRVQCVSMTHPLLQNPVPNSLCWERSALITGSNASGKSTFSKAMAVNCILAQTICTCFAREFSLCRAQVLTSMAVRDNLLAGESYFLAEIRSLKRILDSAGGKRPVLAFVDEILRGTNTIERIAASASVLKRLGGQNALLMVATHDIELTRILHRDFENWHFQEEVFAGGVRFPYLLLPGPAVSRNALLLLEQLGFEPSVIERAEKLVREFESSNAWPTL